MKHLQASLIIAKLAAPILLGNLSYALLGIFDILMSGLAGTSDLAGVAVGGSFFFPCAMFLTGLMTTLQPVISRLRGEDRFDKIPHAHAVACLCVFFASLVLMAVLLFLALFVIRLHSDERMNYVAVRYVILVAASLPVSALFFGCRAYAEAMGYTKATLYFGLLALVYNIPLNYVLIFGLFGLPALGGIGCAAATLISLTLSTGTFMLFIRLYPYLNQSCWWQNRSKIKWTDIKEFYRLALPLGLSSSIETSCFTLIALLLSPLGPVEVSGHTVAMSVTSLIFNLPLSMGIASSIAIGFQLGRQNLFNLRTLMQSAYRLAMLCALFNMLLLLTLRNEVTSWFSSDPAVCSYAAFLLLFSLANQFSECTQTIQGFMLRGFKDTLTIFKSTLISFYVIALPVGSLCCYGYVHQSLSGARGFWIGIFLGLSFASLYYRRRILFHYKKLKEQLSPADAKTKIPAAGQAEPASA